MKYLIIGGGPSGLTLANSLINNGKDDVLVLERNEEAGGLCRSKNVDGSPLDIGGGHFLDVKNKRVLDFVFDFFAAIPSRYCCSETEPSVATVNT